MFTLYVYVATMLLIGFQLADASSSTFAVPAEWDANSASGLFTAAYRHLNDLSIKFELQVCEAA